MALFPLLSRTLLTLCAALGLAAACVFPLLTSFRLEDVNDSTIMGTPIKWVVMLRALRW